MVVRGVGEGAGSFDPPTRTLKGPRTKWAEQGLNVYAQKVDSRSPTLLRRPGAGRCRGGGGDGPKIGPSHSVGKRRGRRRPRGRPAAARLKSGVEPPDAYGSSRRKFPAQHESPRSKQEVSVVSPLLRVLMCVGGRGAETLFASLGPYLWFRSERHWKADKTKRELRVILLWCGWRVCVGGKGGEGLPLSLW